MKQVIFTKVNSNYFFDKRISSQCNYSLIVDIPVSDMQQNKINVCCLVIVRAKNELSKL